MKFHTESSPAKAKSFNCIAAAGLAADAWFNATSKGERYRVEIYEPHGKTGYLVKIMDDMGFTVGHLAQRSEVHQQFDELQAQRA